MQEKQLGLSLKCLRTDRGGEFLSKEFMTYCEINGICRQFTAPYSLEQNGVAERKNRTVIEMVRSMLKEMNLPTFLWAEVVARAVFILNRSPTSTIKDRTPFEVIKGVKPSIEHLRVFGCVGHVCVDSQFRKKLDPKTQKCVLFGYCEDMKAYKMFDPMTRKIVISRNVRFFEEVHWDWSVTRTKHQRAYLV